MGLDLWEVYGFYLLGGTILVAGIGLGAWKLHQRQAYLKRLWRFTLFFLTKRQMAIPLVYTLAERSGKMGSGELEKLLKIYRQCRETSFRLQPGDRMHLEHEISKFLLVFFSDLERSGSLEKIPALARVVQDLEFIDQKLVDLQKVYNKETEKWNRLLSIPGLNGMVYLLGLRKAEKFENFIDP